MTNPNGIEYVQSKYGRLMRLSIYFEEFFLLYKIVSLLMLIVVIGLDLFGCENTLLRSLAIK
jgi:hypothetical protein